MLKVDYIRYIRERGDKVIRTVDYGGSLNQVRQDVYDALRNHPLKTAGAVRDQSVHAVFYDEGTEIGEVLRYRRRVVWQDVNGGFRTISRYGSVGPVLKREVFRWITRVRWRPRSSLCRQWCCAR